MLREVITPQSDIYKLQIPKKYINKEIEILVLPVYNSNKENNNNFKQLSEKTKGLLLGKGVDPLNWQMEIRNEWAR